MKLTKLLTKTLTRIGLAAVLLPTLNLQLSTAHAQGTAFTYQGVLNDGGAPATGLYDLEFRAFDAVSGGAQQGGLVTASDVPVTNGLFTTSLDFGAAVFTGPARWLNIAVRPGASAGAYSALVPRQPITASPYAVFAGGSAAAGVTGTLPDARLSANVALRAGGNAFTGNQSVMSGNVGIGTTSPQQPLDVVANSSAGLLRLQNTSASGYSVVNVHDNTGAGVGGYGYANPGTAWNAGNSYIASTTPFVFMMGGGLTETVRITPAGNVGIGTATPTSLLHVNGTATATSFSGGGSGLTALNASQLTSGSVPDARLSANVALRAGGNAFTGNQSVMSGNVGIGTTSPQQPLDVVANSSAGLLRLQNTSASGYSVVNVHDNTGAGVGGYGYANPGTAWNAGNSYIASTTPFVFMMGGGLTETVRITPAGNVGIGTTAPGGALHVKGLLNTIVSQSSVAGGTAGSEFLDSGGTSIGYIGNAGGFHSIGWNTEPGDFAIRASSPTGKLFLLTSKDNTPSNPGLVVDGNKVGIGTTTPLTPLHVYGNSAGGAGHAVFQNGAAGDAFSYLALANDAGLNGVIFKNSSTRAGDGGANTMTVRNDAGDLRLQSVGGNGIMVKASNGRVGIGTATPDATLTVAHIAGLPNLELLKPASNIGYQFFVDNNGMSLCERNVACGRLYVQNGTGRVGIGTQTPAAGLQVEVSAGVSAGTWSYMTKGDFNPGTFFGNPNLAIYTTGDIGARSYYAFSDARIKNVVGVSDGARDLTTLRNIEVTDYTHKDVVGSGNRPVKKVVAQQVETVYPQAVSKGTGVVPDIYKMATMKDGWVELATDLKAGDRVKLMDRSASGIYEILETRKGAFRTEFKPEADQVFVVGREVKDFRSVDYEAISMLNVSATQELARQVKAQESELTELRAELIKLRGERTSLAQTVSAMEARFVRLEQAMHKPTVPAVKDVSASADVK